MADFEPADLDSLWRELVSALAHELRTPLNTGLGWVQMLRRGMLEQAQEARALEATEGSLRLQAAVLDKVESFSQILAEEAERAPQDVPLEPLVRAVASSAPSTTDKERGRVLVHRAESGAAPRSRQELSVLASASALEQALRLLIEAALARTSPGDVEIDWRAVAGAVEVTIGGPKGLQGQDAPAPVFFRRGLGLVMATWLLRMQGASLVIEGSRFVVTLLAPAHE